MQRLSSGRGIHELYSPKSRFDAFPEADFRFIVHVAANIARAFATIHAHGLVAGDVNHGNLAVGADGTVKFIDCDSFQIGTGNTVFTCDVGVPLFTPSELQNKSFRGLVRTFDHDRFGFAVLLFHLLFMGRHPFAGRYTGRGEMPIERAIAEHRFAYWPDNAQNEMQRPPGTIPIGIFGNSIANLFIGAFGKASLNGGRPTAETWVEALEQLKANLQVCQKASWHHYPRHLKGCPWCIVETKTGVRLFGSKLVHTASGIVDISSLWNAIVSIPSPAQDPPLPSEKPWTAPAGERLPNNRLKNCRKILSGIIVCAGLAAWDYYSRKGGGWAFVISVALAIYCWPRTSYAKQLEAERKVAAARSGWENLLNRWKREASVSVFQELLKGLEKHKQDYLGLPNERRRMLAKLDAQRKAAQSKRYLDRFRIDHGQIRNIGPSRTAMLASYGVETAADIQPKKILKIPGFGDFLTNELVAWREGHEKNFRFNPNEPIDSRDIAEMDRHLESKRQSLLSALRDGSRNLQRVSLAITAARPRLLPLMEQAWTAVKMAELYKQSL